MSSALTAAAVLLSALVALPVPCFAAPITYRYTGSVIGSAFPPSLPFVPVGTPATFTLTADPDHPLAIPNLPSYMASYETTLAVTVAGLNYVINGYLEVNGDVLSPNNPSAPASGFVNLREFLTAGPSFLPYVPRLCPPTFGCLEFNSAPTNPNSRELLLPYPTFSFPIQFQGALGEFAAIRITGSNPQVVPEPTSLTLMTIGLMGIRFISKRAKPARV
jgi:hypothetical protein